MVERPEELNPEDFTPEGMERVVTDSSDMFDDWFAARGHVTYRRRLRNQRDALAARVAVQEAALKNARGLLDTPIARRRHAGDSFYGAVVEEIRAALSPEQPTPATQVDAEP